VSEPSPELSLVIPAYNEQDRLPQTLPVAVQWCRQQARSWEIRVVDDGSEDDTCGVVERIAAELDEPRLLLQREPHRGKGGAVKAGMLASDADWRFLCDADFSMPVAEVERFLPPYLVGEHVIIGTREGAGAVRVGEPESRHVMGRVFNTIVQTLLVPGISDSQCGFKCFSRQAVEDLFPHVTIDGFAFDVEVLFLARKRGYHIAEVPITWYYMEASKVRPFRDTRRMLTEVLRIRASHLAGGYA
jgi:dolichyl-phosphate beta-glucosyltransferase